MNFIGTDFHTQKKIKQSDIAAFEMLFREFYSPLCHFAAGFVSDMDAAQEIVQEFFYNYWKNREKIQIRISVKSYLYSSIRNMALKHIEQQQVRRRYAAQVLAASEESQQVDQLDQLQAKEMQKVIDQTLAALPDRCSLIFRMSRLEGKKYHEIAEALSISVKTVEANIGKALQHLRLNLEKYGKEPLQRS